MPFVSVLSRRIEVQQIDVRSGGPTIVLLHEGLGSIAMWKDFPGRLAHACNANVVVYSRYGYGQSDPLDAPRRPDFMHVEAQQALPELLDRLEVDAPILVGHSDGGSIALLYAAHAARQGRSLPGIVVMAPHVLVEDISLSSISVARTAYLQGDLRARLERYHADVDSAFWGWNDIWLAPAFRDWNIEDCLPDIRCPILAVQGEDDEYGTMDQIERIGRGAPDVDSLRLEDCRHSPHRDQPDVVLAAITQFVDRLGAPATGESAPQPLFSR